MKDYRLGYEGEVCIKIWGRWDTEGRRKGDIFWWLGGKETVLLNFWGRGWGACLSSREFCKEGTFPDVSWPRWNPGAILIRRSRSYGCVSQVPRCSASCLADYGKDVYQLFETSGAGGSRTRQLIDCCRRRMLSTLRKRFWRHTNFNATENAGSHTLANWDIYPSLYGMSLRDVRKKGFEACSRVCGILVCRVNSTRLLFHSEFTMQGRRWSYTDHMKV